jgi:hypothetical protein
MSVFLTTALDQVGQGTEVLQAQVALEIHGVLVNKAPPTVGVGIECDEEVLNLSAVGGTQVHPALLRSL